jgi:spore germination cell wall hydrolase CwlJ-like protein
MSSRKQRGHGVALVVTVALIAALLAVVLALSGTPEQGPSIAPALAQEAGPTSPPPAVMPFVIAREDPDQARASNAAVPVAPGAPQAAAPFHYAGAAADRAAADACLAAAILYEAGDDPPGERAVAQVVLNRLRHPAFPKTVCGVVFEGSERHTGCQFTFTCDGALTRPVAPAAWMRARTIATAALDGAVYRPVGTATHYHTDWVVPYWRSSLEKIAIVHTQIFYRWPGYWGSRAVLNGALRPGEQPDPRIVRLAGLTVADAALPAVVDHAPAALVVAGVPPAALGGNSIRLKDEDAGQFVLLLNPASPASFAIAAFTLCGDKIECSVYGWTTAAELPASLPVARENLRTLAFAYRKSRSLGIAQSYWDCARFPRPLPSQCLAG